MTAANTNDLGAEIHEQTISITVKLESWAYYCIAQVWHTFRVAGHTIRSSMNPQVLNDQTETANETSLVE
jgi:hypothetical protein